MSSSRLCRSTRVVAAILLLTSVWQLPHRSSDDVCLPPSAESHDESKHVFTAASDSGHPDHCAVCHWTRLLKPDLSVRTASLGAGGAGSTLSVPSSSARRDRFAENLPSRAPPSAHSTSAAVSALLT